jgi:hypothetical protein
MSNAAAKQELAEARNTIAQLRNNQALFKKQRREGWNNRRENGNESHGYEQQGARKNVTVPEGAGPGPKPAASPPRRVQVKMLWASRESSDSDKEPKHELAYLVLAQMERPIIDVKVAFHLLM